MQQIINLPSTVSATVRDPVRMRRTRWVLIWFCVAYFAGTALLSTITHNSRIGIDLNPIRCLPWRVYFVHFDPASPAATGNYVAFYPRNGLMGKRFEGKLIGKLVAATQGDHVVVRGDFAWVNGRPIGKLTLNSKLGKGPGAFDREETVPEGKLFVIGTEPQSYDSRYWGFLNKSDVVGSVRPLI